MSDIYSSLARGTNYSIRMSAANGNGYGEFSSLFSVATPETGIIPSAPTSVSLLPCGNSQLSLRLNFKAPIFSGGSNIDSYFVEWSNYPEFAEGVDGYGSELLSIIHEVQTLVVDFRSGDSVKTRGGAFTIGWGGVVSAPLSWDISASDLKRAVQGVMDLRVVAENPVYVTRNKYRHGFKWTIVFKTWAGDLSLLQVQGAMLQGDKPSAFVLENTAGSADIVPGTFTAEIQAISVSANSLVSGTFRLKFDGMETQNISVSESPDSLKWKLGQLQTIFASSVRRYVVNQQLNLFTWHVTFSHNNPQLLTGAANLALLQVSSSSLSGNSATIIVTRLVRGTNQFIYSISNLVSGNIFARVTAHNKNGFGPPSAVTSETLIAQPGTPQHLTPSISSGSCIDLHWLPPLFGSEPDTYKLEWFRNYGVSEVQMITTSAEKGVDEIQTVSTMADAPGLGGYFTLSFGSQTTVDIAWDAPAEGIASVQDALDLIPEIGEVVVTREFSKKTVYGLKLDLVSGTEYATMSSSSLISPSHTDLVVHDIIFVAGFAAQIKNFSSGGRIFFSRELNSSLPATYTLQTVSGMLVEKWSYGYTYSITFLGQNGAVPLLVAAPSSGWTGANPVVKVEETQRGMEPISGTFRIGYQGFKTEPLACDVDAATLKDALESLYTIGEVQVERARTGFGFTWFVTFITELGDLDLMYADDNQLNGPSATVFVSVGRDGVLPLGYCEGDSNGLALILPTSTMLSTKVCGLSNGNGYIFLLRAGDSAGFGYHKISTPISIAPLEAPGIPQNIELIVLNDKLLKAVWTKPTYDGGTSITKYSVEWDTSNSFLNASQVGFRNEIFVSSTDTGPFYLNFATSSATQWFVQVRSFNNFAWSDYGVSSPFSVSPHLQPPGYVQNPSATIISGVGLLVEWQEPSVELPVYGGDGGSVIEGYLLEWDTSENFDSPAERSFLPSTELHYILGGRDLMTGKESTTLERGMTYFVRISAFNRQGFGFVSSTTPAQFQMRDVLPTQLQSVSAATLSVDSIVADWNYPFFDGGETLETIRVEWDVDNHFSNVNSSSKLGGNTELNVVKEMQAFAVSADVTNEEQWLRATVLVTNEVQTVRTQVKGVDDVQIITTTADSVIPTIQTVTTIATDYNEVQTVSISADDVNEIQSITTSTPQVYNTQTLIVGVKRINQVEKIVITIVGPPGTTANNLVNSVTGFMVLAFDSSNDRWVEYTTLQKAVVRNISNLVHGSNSLNSSLNELSNIRGGVTVSSQLQSTLGSAHTTVVLTYLVEFSGDNVRGKLDGLNYVSAESTLSGTNLNVTVVVSTSVVGSEPGGCCLALTYSCESLVTKTLVNVTQGQAAAYFVASDVHEFDVLRIYNESGWDYYYILSYSSPKAVLDQVYSGKTSHNLQAEYGTFYSDPKAAYGVSDNCLLQDPDTTKPIFEIYKDPTGSDVVVALQALPQISSASGAVLLRKTSLPAGNNITFNGKSYELVGFNYTITFTQANGNPHDLLCNTGNFNSTHTGAPSICGVVSRVAGSLLGGTFNLGLTYPHWQLGTPLQYTTPLIRWNANPVTVKNILQAVKDNLNYTDVFGFVAVSRTPFVPDGDTKWSGQYTWTIEFLSRGGNVPPVVPSSTYLISSTGLTTHIYVNGYGEHNDGNEISGTFGLSFTLGISANKSGSVFTSYMSSTAFKNAFNRAFFF